MLRPEIPTLPPPAYLLEEAEGKRTEERHTEAQRTENRRSDERRSAA
jgi:hypothetical protein